MSGGGLYCQTLKKSNFQSFIYISNPRTIHLHLNCGGRQAGRREEHIHKYLSLQRNVKESKYRLRYRGVISYYPFRAPRLTRGLYVRPRHRHMIGKIIDSYGGVFIYNDDVDSGTCPILKFNRSRECGSDRSPPEAKGQVH